LSIGIDDFPGEFLQRTEHITSAEEMWDEVKEL
jgi:hypothetical protein